MFDGLVYLVDLAAGTATTVFDCEDIVPHVEVPVRGGRELGEHAVTSSDLVNIRNSLTQRTLMLPNR